MSNEIKDALKVLQDSMQDTDLGSYAHSWHCNLAMAFYDAATADKHKGLSHAKAHKIANEGASRFMKLLFDVETTNS